MRRRRSWSTSELARGVRAGEKRALARALSVVEAGEAQAEELVRELYPDTGRSYTIGVTGPPGVGKSTLIGALVRHVRESGKSVGVVTVDPSSPFSKGALLGDRIRLSEHFLDPEVFIRSMGTRGHAGGLAEATLQALLVLDAAGRDLLFVETAGVGQNEVAVSGVADTIVLVLMPGSGDSVQALKAGIMEIPDVIALNKSDYSAATAAMAELKQALSLGAEKKPPALIATRADSAESVAALWQAIEAHRSKLEEGGGLERRRRENLVREVLLLTAGRAKVELERAASDDSELKALFEDVAERRLDPLSAVRLAGERVRKLTS